MNELSDWLTRELANRAWSMRELGRKSGVSHAQISNVVSGIAEPSADFCIKIATALDFPPITLMRYAGILPPKSTAKEDEEILLHYFNQLGFRDQIRLIAIARTLASERNEFDARATNAGIS